MKSAILVIDQGTTGTGVSLVSAQGKIIMSADHEFDQIYPQPGWVEHNPDLIWQTVTDGILQVSRWAKKNQYHIECLGITNQRETTVAWDQQGKPLYQAIVWQCRRTTERCQQLKRLGWGTKVKQKTGLVLDPYFSATKMEWLLKKAPLVKLAKKQKTLHFGTIDSFLVYRLTQGQSFVTDVSNASRTMLLNLKTRKWDNALLKLFGIDSWMLPQVQPSGSHFGQTQGIPGLPDGLPITGVIGDQQSALFGQLALKPGEAKVTFGTGSFILANTGHQLVQSRAGLLTTIAWQLPGQAAPIYALEGGAFICGAAVQWLRDGLKLIKSSSDIESLANQVTDSAGVQFVPALTGLGAPHWLPDVRGMIMGLTRGTQQAHLARATLEAMALQNVDILAVMQAEIKKPLKSLKVDGGASQNNLLMQMQADYMGIKVIRPQQIETTTLGAAYMAGLTQGIWQSTDQLQRLWLEDNTFAPTISLKERKQRLKYWHQAIQMSQPQ